MFTIVSDVRRGDTVALIVGNDLNLAVLVHSDTRVRRAEIDANGGVDLLLLTLLCVVGSRHAPEHLHHARAPHPSADAVAQGNCATFWCCLPSVAHAVAPHVRDP